MVKDAEARTYAEGEVIDVNEASANHFISRGAAVEVTKAVAPVAQTETIGGDHVATVDIPRTAVRPRGRPRKGDSE